VHIHLITGGARAGKSRLAQERAWALGGPAVTFIATARPWDGEMRQRIARHRADRPPAWITHEVPHDVGPAIEATTTPVVVLDCFTILLSNALLRARPGNEQQALAGMAAETSGVLAGAAAPEGHLLVVTNEVGCGVHPETSLGRWFREGLGIGNQRLAAAAAEVVLVVCGLPVAIRSGTGTR
jgi:adenosyl cobinamide kinase/adenosyl cobinamide phosphate guanylyltransferase